MKGHKYRKALVYFKDIEAGVLEEYKNGFRFTYNEDFKKKGIPISVSLSLLDRSHESNELFPFFVGLLPEGWYLDIVSSKLVIPGEEDLALPMNGKRNNITVRDFRKFSNYLKIPAKAYGKILSHYLEGRDMIVDVIEHSALDEEEKQGFLDIVNDRYRRLHIG